MPPIRILLVDDDPSVHRTVGEWLRAAGYDTTEADSPAAAETIRSSREFDIILSDIQMPGNSRLQWVDRLLQDPNSPPVILMTGDPQLETAMQAANLAISAYLLKPVNFTELAALLERLALSQHQRADAREMAAAIMALLARDDSPRMDAALREKLVQVADHLDRSRFDLRSTPRDQAREDPLQAAITDAVATIRRTKGSFHSKELGALRQRLEKLSRPPKTQTNSLEQAVS